MDLLSILIDWSPYIVSGIAATLGLVLIALGIGALLGLPMALGQVYGSRPVRWIIGIYVWFFRGLPILVLLFLFWFGIFPGIGLGNVPAFVVGAVVLGLRGAAYQSQIFRGAIQSVSEGQMIAARSLGMSRFTAIRSVILPQAMRIALPGWSNEYPNMLTDSAVCYAIGVAELLTVTSRIVAQTYLTMPIFLAAAGIFIILNYGGLKVLHGLERKIAIPGFGSGAV
ncbi:ABC-type amino acid transport system, permease component [Methanoculleus bourgensis MS2]|mgnify:FL=1|jgi:polar amino acid transport system permease protein|uniref:ABC-type amino acid transport system, permease component n=1 Tax=Methanoculleus bourgensis (strain ATCC 43281 / DSM 3045 / OCM 15 / MS2) TaxID=1201294 RepID=I7JAI5_METBM|nr:amino acid ABC transporter permease [Methanoculleus bourgensis]CCJ37168.1 ABC-type amino acid transport system, permease component [Methanoculleus bourgensis MS2]